MSPQRKDEKVSIVNYEVNIKLVQTSEFETDAEADVQDMVIIIRIKVGGKRTPVNVDDAPLDNLSFHYETSVQKWRYALLRWVYCEKNLGTNALDCK